MGEGVPVSARLGGRRPWRARAYPPPAQPLTGPMSRQTVIYATLGVIMAALVRTPDVLDLGTQFAFYASYHRDPINVAIHLCAIWPLFWSALVLLHKAALAPSPALLVAIVYAGYYVLLDRTLGPVSALAVAACYGLAGRFSRREGSGSIAAALHVALWLLQFAGHFFFEGRQPALVQNLAQALVMAPHFVVMELGSLAGLPLDR